VGIVDGVSRGGGRYNSCNGWNGNNNKHTTGRGERKGG
jgi:hypothetical protein